MMAAGVTRCSGDSGESVAQSKSHNALYEAIIATETY